VSDLAVISQPGALDEYADAGAFIIHSCERAKDWLTQCIAHGEIDDIVELKSQAEAIRVYTTTKQLGRDAELAAAEIVRRAERGIGVCIRKGQEAGEIAVQGLNIATAQRQHRVVKTVFDYVTAAEWRGNEAGLVHLTDGVTDEQFDKAITEAKAEGNLSRANVVRKVARTSGGKAAKPKQSDDSSSRLAAPQPARFGPRRRHLQQIEALIASLAGALIAFDGVHSLDDTVTAEEAGVLSADLSTQIQAMTRINKLLRERTT
jgi:hypothetical protein